MPEELRRHTPETKEGSLARRLRLAELTSGLGAGVLGLGQGVLAAGFLRGLGLPALIAGLLLHVWGMTDRHRLEAEFLGALAVYVAARALGV